MTSFIRSQTRRMPCLISSSVTVNTFSTSLLAIGHVSLPGWLVRRPSAMVLVAAGRGTGLPAAKDSAQSFASAGNRSQPLTRV